MYRYILLLVLDRIAAKIYNAILFERTQDIPNADKIKGLQEARTIISNEADEIRHTDDYTHN